MWCCSLRARTWRICSWRAPRRGARSSACGSRWAHRACASCGSCSPRACCSRARARCWACSSHSGAAACSCASCRPRRQGLPRPVARLARPRLHRGGHGRDRGVVRHGARAARHALQPNDALKAQGRGVIGDGASASGAHARRPAGGAVARPPRRAGLFIRTFSSLASLDLGFDTRPILVATVEMPERTDRTRQTVRAVPATAGGGRRCPGRVERGVVRADAARQQHVEQPHRVAGWPAAAGSRAPDLLQHGERRVVSDLRHADACRTRLHERRHARHARVAIVNEAFARRFTGGRNPIGTRVRAQGASRQIVGYVRDAVYESVRAPVPPTLYLPYGQEARCRTPRRSACARPADRPRCWPSRSRPRSARCTATSGITFRPLADQVDAALTQERVVAALSAFFGALALLLAGLGLYGVTSYSVSRRRTEIGIRDGARRRARRRGRCSSCGARRCSWPSGSSRERR